MSPAQTRLSLSLCCMSHSHTDPLLHATPIPTKGKDAGPFQCAAWPNSHFRSEVCFEREDGERVFQ